MQLGTYLSDIEIGQIIAFKKENYSSRMIAQKVGQLKTVVNNFLSDPEKYGSSKKLNERDCRAIKRQASNAVTSCSKVQHTLDLDISHWIVWNELQNSLDFTYCKHLTAPPLSERHVAEQLDCTLSLLLICHVSSPPIQLFQLSRSKVYWTLEHDVTALLACLLIALQSLSFNFFGLPAQICFPYFFGSDKKLFTTVFD